MWGLSNLGTTIWLSDALLLTFLLISVLFLVKQLKGIQAHYKAGKSGKLHIPTVPYWCPAGHAGKFVWDPAGFLYSCYKRYGKVFTIKLGWRKCTILCSRDLVKEYFSGGESSLSLYKFLNSIFVNEVTTDNLDNMNTTLKAFLQNSFNPQMSEYVENVNDEMKSAIGQFKEQVAGNNTRLVDEDEIMRNTYVRAIFKSMFAVEISPKVSAVIETSFNWFSVTALASTFLPEFIAKNVFLRRAVYWRRKCVNILLPHVREYFENKNTQESVITRQLVDYNFEERGSFRKFSEEEVGEILLTFYLQMMSSPVPSCYQILKELTHRKDLWYTLRNELKGASVDEISRNKTLQACVMEGIRLNANLIVSVRSPVVNRTLGSYDLGNTDVVAVPGALLFEMDPAEDVFEQANLYNPERFLSKEEPMDSKSIWLWGGGVHTCPGKRLSLLCIKIFITHFVNELNAEVVTASRKNYSSLRSVASQKIKFRLA